MDRQGIDFEDREGIDFEEREFLRVFEEVNNALYSRQTRSKLNVDGAPQFLAFPSAASFCWVSRPHVIQGRNSWRWFHNTDLFCLRFDIVQPRESILSFR